MAGMSSLVRIVNAGVPGSQDRVDVVLRDGVVASVNPAGTDLASHGAMPAGAHTAFSAHTSNAADTGSTPTPTPAAAPADETTINADGLWIIPGLWDCHTHFTQWAKTLGRLDLINARSAAVDESGLVGELEWFNAYTTFDKAPGAAEETDRLLREAEQDAASKGVVGIRDYEMAENIDTWINRFAAGINGLRVDAGVYPERLQVAIDAGWHTGKELPGSAGLGHVGAMKLISDGSLNTRSAYCSTSYSGIEPPTYGTLSYTPQQIEDYMRLATEHGFDIACHAIGDEANTIVLNAAAATHAHGSIEHAQMLKPVDIPRFAELGLTASIQPQHAMDDRDVITRFWANPAGIPYPFKALHDAGAMLRMGSDAPVAPLDPWLAISAAVFGAESSDREPFQPEQCLDVRTSLSASTATGRDRLAAGDPADVVLLDTDPYCVSAPEAMRAMSEHVVMTLLRGERMY